MIFVETPKIFKDNFFFVFKKFLKFLKNIVDFSCTLFYDFLYWFVFLYCGDTNSVFKIPGFHQDIQDFQIYKKKILLSKNF